MKTIRKLDNITKDIPFFYVGRLYSSQKRFHLIKETFDLAGIKYDNLVVSGPERPPIGQYVGFLQEEELSLMYNRSQFIFCPCSYEGSLMAIEGQICGAIPLVCNDNNWGDEFGWQPFSAEPNAQSLLEKTNEIYQNIEKYRKIIDELSPTYIEKMEVSNVAKRLLRFHAEL